MNEQPYKPIACGDYDIYEIAIMQNRLLTLCIPESLNELLDESLSESSTNQTRIVVRPLSLVIENGAEYLNFSLPVKDGDMDKNVKKIRLDKIQKAEFSKA